MKSYEKGSSETLEAYYYIFTLFQQKRGFFAEDVTCLEGKNSLLKNISVALKIMSVFRFFLSMAKVMHFSVLLIIVLINVLVMECLQTGTQRALDLNSCK